MCSKLLMATLTLVFLSLKMATCSTKSARTAARSQVGTDSLLQKIERWYKAQMALLILSIPLNNFTIDTFRILFQIFDLKIFEL